MIKVLILAGLIGVFDGAQVRTEAVCANRHEKTDYAGHFVGGE